MTRNYNQDYFKVAGSRYEDSDITSKERQHLGCQQRNESGRARDYRFVPRRKLGHPVVFAFRGEEVLRRAIDLDENKQE
ncbi:MAG: hypothetical protein V2A73_16620 [Pseudomonadota bacterium]